MSEIKRLCVFCGSSTGKDASFEKAARRLGQELAARDIELVYGGGNVGLMGALANEVLAARGKVTGVIPKGLVSRELAHKGLTQLHQVETMHERKQKMHDLSDGFLSLPGGLGTFEELLETLTWAQLGIHQKPCAVLNVSGYFDGLLALFKRAVAEGLLRETHRDLLLIGSEAGELLDKMAAWKAPVLTKWVGRGEE